RNCVEVWICSLLIDHYGLVVWLIGIVGDRFKGASQPRKAAVGTNWIRLVLDPQRKRDREIRSRAPFILSVDAQVVGGDAVRTGHGKPLIQCREISFSAVCIKPSLVEGVEGKGNQISSRANSEGIVRVEHTQKSDSDSQLMTASNPGQVI